MSNVTYHEILPLNNIICIQQFPCMKMGKPNICFIITRNSVAAAGFHVGKTGIRISNFCHIFLPQEIQHTIHFVNVTFNCFGEF